MLGENRAKMAANGSLWGGAGLKRSVQTVFLTFAAIAAARGGSIFALFVFKKNALFCFDGQTLDFAT